MKMCDNCEMRRKGIDFHVKKRDNNYINEVRKVLKPVNFVPNGYGDRFIPRRYAQTSSSRFKAECKNNRATDLMRMKERNGYWRVHPFATAFHEVFQIERMREGTQPSSGTDRILSFWDATNQRICQQLAIQQPLATNLEPTYRNLHRLDWACKPRPKPVTFIESVHDLPRIKVEHTNIIDWSAKGQIAAIFSKRLVIWTPNTEDTIAYCAYHTSAIAFNPTGEVLAMATYSMARPVLRLISRFKPNVKPLVSRQCYGYLGSDISCLTWDSTGRFLACGLGCGRVIIIRRANLEHLNRTNEQHTHSSRVVAIKFSGSSKYLATSDESGHLYIWAWNNCQLSPLTVWISKGIALFDWHPWREEEIIIVDSEPVTIALFHVPSRKVLSFHRRLNADCIVTAVAFNKVSGELVVSYSYPAGMPPDLVVLGSMDRVVDVMKNHDDVVAHLFWSPDGKQLASAGCDEALTIWNFFGTSPANGQTQQIAQPQHYNRNKPKPGPIGGFDYTFLYKPMR